MVGKGGTFAVGPGRHVHSLRHCFDNTFVLIEQMYLTNFADHVNNVEPSIKFIMETESNDSIPFLDGLAKRGTI